MACSEAVGPELEALEDAAAEEAFEDAEETALEEAAEEVAFDVVVETAEETADDKRAAPEDVPEEAASEESEEAPDELEEEPVAAILMLLMKERSMNTASTHATMRFLLFHLICNPLKYFLFPIGTLSFSGAPITLSDIS